ncbi:MAG: cellulose biosynthesis cyclic di-GMP-binding regulatory protein BcsB [Betaproteobacteria bacterium]|nr:cellulose biosynthesis cyclic di-GMP-binding regulatory protein BcsB [Betaproteobacteria bacterium]
MSHCCPHHFFDRRDSRRLELPFVLAPALPWKILRASGVIASWLVRSQL